MPHPNPNPRCAGSQAVQQLCATLTAANRQLTSLSRCCVGGGLMAMRCTAGHRQLTARWPLLLGSTRLGSARLGSERSGVERRGSHHLTARGPRCCDGRV
jgi:hypothetical protein